MTERAVAGGGSAPSNAGGGRWTRSHVAALAAIVLAGIGIRVLVWPARGLVGDIDQFVLWVHGIAVNGWDRTYDQNLSFPAVMAWVWGALAAVEPAFRTVTDSSDTGIRILMKVPASLADLALAAGVAWWFRDRPWVAVAAAGAVLLWPVTWYVSAWWGQYEPIYVLPALLAVLTARAGRPGWTAVLVAISLMTKPQALPFVVSFAAWFLATQGWRGTLRAAGIGAVTVLVVWLPFLAANGPINYLRNLGTYQNELYNVVSVSAWNPWWLLQEFRADGQYVLDSGTLIGPISYRVVSLALTAVFSFVVFLAVYRRPSAEQLALGLGVIALVTFVGLTTMHERYAYPAFVFLLLAATRRRVAVTWLAFAIVFLLNMVAVVPPDGWDPSALEALAPIGAVVMTILAAAATIDLVRARPTRLDVPT